jgi:hypothetical protein
VRAGDVRELQYEVEVLEQGVVCAEAREDAREVVGEDGVGGLHDEVEVEGAQGGESRGVDGFEVYWGAG